MERIEFPVDFSEFLKSLNDAGVEYLLVGGFAVAIHGYPRATADMDVWIAIRRSNAERVVQALITFGFSSPPPDVELFLQPDRIVRMGVAPIRIEILTSIDGVEFDDCSRRSVTYVVDGEAVPVIGRDDLLRSKRASGRAKDLADLRELEHG